MRVSPCRSCASLTTERILKAASFEVWRCKKCDIGFTLPQPVLPDYTNLDFHSSTSNNEAILTLKDLPLDWQRLINIQCSLLKNYFRAEDKILEIGCGEGILLSELKNNNFVNLYGVEPSKSAASRAIGKGLTVANEYFDPDKYSEIDGIVMSHVLEHIEDINHFINLLHKTLTPGGKIIITQTNYKGLLPKVQKENWYAWVPEQHFWHFSVKSLDILMKKFNLKRVDWVYSSLVHPNHLAYRLSNMIPFLRDQYIVVYEKKS